MLKKIIFLLLLLKASSLFCQTAGDTLQISNAYFSQSLSLAGLNAKQFVLKASLRVAKIDSTANAAVWARIEQSGGKTLLQKSTTTQGALGTNWQTYTLQGVMDSSADRMFFGGSAAYNGRFYFDDFSLSIQNQNGEWKTVPITDQGFESNTLQAWKSGQGKRIFFTKGFTQEVTSVFHSDGNHSLMLSGNGVMNYGANFDAGHTYKINGINIYCETYGSGFPLLLLHGNVQSISAFAGQIPFFISKYQLIIPDCRARGRSGDNDEPLTYPIQADDMRQLLDSMHIKTCNIIGWSDGGIIGLIMAMQYPSMVNKLVVSGANIQQDESVFGKKSYETMSARRMDTSFLRMTRRLLGLMLDGPSIPFTDLSKIKAPVQYVMGDRDQISFEHTLQMYRATPRAQFFVVPGTSHYVLSEQPQVFNQAVWKFLQ
ncbi:MAG: alpha/beta hydrolase [Bacteroidota bacterium]